MPCSDSSSIMLIKIDPNECLVNFEYAKITCSSEIKGGTGLNEYFTTKKLAEIIEIPFDTITHYLNPKDEETQFILYMEWDSLRCAVGEYLGIDDPRIDRERCKVTSISHTEKGTEVALVILPPKELPKILPCSLANQKNQA